MHPQTRSMYATVDHLLFQEFIIRRHLGDWRNNLWCQRISYIRAHYNENWPHFEIICVPVSCSQDSYKATKVIRLIAEWLKLCPGFNQRPFVSYFLRYLMHVWHLVIIKYLSLHPDSLKFLNVVISVSFSFSSSMTTNEGKCFLHRKYSHSQGTVFTICTFLRGKFWANSSLI